MRPLERRRCRPPILRTLLAAILAVLTGLSSGCSAQGTRPNPTARGLALREVVRGLDHPVHLTSPENDPRLFVTEQPGRIRIIKDGRLLDAPFLDIVDKVSFGGERGLLSVAFHPRYASNGFFYVNYTDNNGDTRVERYHVGSDADRADPASGMQVLFVSQPYANHNGGHILFGPDGKLYVGMGDGGSAGDPHGNGQNKNSLLGKILRIDVDQSVPYSIPSDNPYATSGGKSEIWAVGLRNPWRFAFDRAENTIYIGDVGQNNWEEVHAASASTPGLNYGWKIKEGKHCFADPQCSDRGLTAPVIEYSHGDGCSVTGGLVYRGRTLPAILGHYFYADYCSGWIRSFRLEGGQATQTRQWFDDVGPISSFGEDSRGELYVVMLDGRVLQIVAGDEVGRASQRSTPP